jgi:hypothetical protein
MIILTATVRSNGFANGLENHFSDFDLTHFNKLHPESRLSAASEEIVRDLRTLC